MPARPHRTVDRVTGILETVSLNPRGVTLAELATALDAAKSSVQELTNGLLARGYLVQEDGRFHLGPGPFILAARANRLAALFARPPVRPRAARGARVQCPRRRARRGRHRLRRPRGRGVTRPDLRGPHPRPPPAVLERCRQDVAGQRPRRRDVPPPGPRRARAGRRRAAVPGRAPRDPSERTGLQPRRHACGGVRRRHAAVRRRRRARRGRSVRRSNPRKQVVSTTSATRSRRRSPSSHRATGSIARPDRSRAAA